MQDITRRTALATAAAAAVMPVSLVARDHVFGQNKYRRSIIIDAQGGFGDPSAITKTILDLRSSGLTAVSLTMGLVGNGPDRMGSVIRDIAQADGWIARNPSVILPIRRWADVTLAKASGRTGLIYNIQDTACLEGDVANVGFLKDLGLRILQLTYNKRNLCGDGCLEPGNAGVSDFGHQVIAAVNEQRLLLDLSHGGRRTISEAARASRAPPAVTHTACRALVNNQRNMEDDQMREIADRGGVVGIYLIAYLRSGIGQPALNARGEDLVAHLEHALKICGEDHVGIGTDGGVSALVIDQAALDHQRTRFADRVRQGFATAGEGPDVFNYVPEYNTPTRLLTLASDLARRGWTTRQIEKLIGGNFARLFQEVWDA